MQRYDLGTIAAPEQLAAHARRNFPTRQEHHHETTVREVEYKGHRIVIETIYHITVDGVPVTGHVQVGNDGRVHYHAIPNQQFDSAVEMVERVIDLTPPGEPTAPTPPPEPPHHHHGMG